jgi:predicted ester cyclase
MKNQFYATMVVVLMLTTSTLFAQKENITNKNIAFYAHVWDVVINEGRVNILDTAYAENAVLHTIPATKGKANCITYYANYVTGFSNRQFTIKESFAQGNKLAKYWQFKGKHTGNFFGIPATNKEVDVIGCTIATIVNGKITAHCRRINSNVSCYHFLFHSGLN